MKHEVAINRSLRRRDPIKFTMGMMDASVSIIWAEMTGWTPEQRRARSPELLNEIGRLEMRLMVMRQRVTQDIAGSFELVAPARVGVVSDEDENEGD